jgi:hypothetical protein
MQTANQTNLAIKGIIAIQAMADISQQLGVSSDADSYSVCTGLLIVCMGAYCSQGQAQNLYKQWKGLALAADEHLLAAYGDDSSSWSLGYNLFVDKWLGTNLIEPSVSRCDQLRSGL